MNPGAATVEPADTHAELRVRLRRFRRLAFVVGAACVMVGALVVYGWRSGNGAIQRLGVDTIPMAPNTAVAFIGAGLALALLIHEPVGPVRRAVTVLLEAIPFAVGALTLAEYVTGRELGVDALVLSGRIDADDRVIPPSFNGALAWVLIALALVLIDSTPRRMPRPTSVLCALAAFGPIVALAAYIYGTHPYFGIPGVLAPSGLALSSSLLLIALCVAILCARPRQGMMAVVTSSNSGGYMARRFLLGALAFPIAGFVVSLGPRFGWFDATLGESLLGAAGLFLALTLIGTVGSSLNASDRERHRAVAALRESEDRQRLLSDLTGSLPEWLDLERMLEALVRRSVPQLADWVMVDVAVPEGEAATRRTAIIHASPAKRRAADELLRRTRGPTRLRAEITEALSSSQPLLIRDVDRAWLEMRAPDPEWLRLVLELGARSYMVIPLPSRTGAVATLTFVCADRNFTDEDFEVAKEIARRAGIAAENARHYEETRRAVRTREDVLAIVSHDLKNPLNTIRLSTQLLQKKIASQSAFSPQARADVERTIAAITRAAQSAMKLIGDLLDFARFESGNWQLEPRGEHASTLLDEMHDQMRPQADAAGIRLDVSGPDDLIVRCDRLRVLQVLSNIVGNALKFQRGGDVVVRAERGPPGQAVFSVHDQGPGIAPEDTERIFDRYWQPEATQRQGTGLGLSIARHIVLAHGGRIWVESKLGEGSTFLFTLPLTDLVAAEPSPPASAPAKE